MHTPDRQERNHTRTLHKEDDNVRTFPLVLSGLLIAVLTATLPRRDRLGGCAPFKPASLTTAWPTSAPIRLVVLQCYPGSGRAGLEQVFPYRYRDFWSAFEQRVWLETQEVEALAFEAYERSDVTAARELLTSFAARIAYEAQAEAHKLRLWLEAVGADIKDGT